MCRNSDNNGAAALFDYVSDFIECVTSDYSSSSDDEFIDEPTDRCNC